MIGILETQVKAHKMGAIQKKFGSKWCWQCNYGYSPKGRIWVGWHSDKVDVTICQVHLQFIHLSVASKNSSFHCMCTLFYGMHTLEDRKDLWRALNTLNIQLSPWLIAGDFHSVMHCDERLNGAPVTNHETQDFVDCVAGMNLTELKSIGCFDSWTNKGSGESRIASRIDRGIVNSQWMLK